VFGFIVSIAFLFLEIRNVELVNIGRNVLKNLDLEVSKKDANPNYREALYESLHKKYSKRIILIRLFKHEFLLRLIYMLIASIWVYLFINVLSSGCNNLYWRYWVPALLFGLSIFFAYKHGYRGN
jgi:hypothetical protein